MLLVSVVLLVRRNTIRHNTTQYHTIPILSSVMPANAHGSLYSNTILYVVDCVLFSIRLNNTPWSTLMLRLFFYSDSSDSLELVSVATEFTSSGNVDAEIHTVMPNAMGVKLNASINSNVIISVAAGSSTALPSISGVIVIFPP